MNTNVCIIILGVLCASGLLDAVQAADPAATAKPRIAAAKVSDAKGADFLGVLNSKISFVPRSEDKTLSRHYTPFSGPPGPTLPYGANINPARSASDIAVIRYTAGSKPFIYDFPPGAKIRQAIAVTQ